MPKERWKVVRLHRFKAAEIVSSHWWYWTACLAAAIYGSSEQGGNFDVWRIPT